MSGLSFRGGKDDLRRGVLTALPIATGRRRAHRHFNPRRCDTDPGTQTLLSAIRKSMPA